jgi:hypothetical protein
MLADFQQALADLTASPELCIAARKNPQIFNDRYLLTEREHQRLVGIVKDKGMECACIVYRANRLAPLALNLPQTCKALGGELRTVVSEFWASSSETNVHFFVETDRFCRFLKAQIATGRTFGKEVEIELARESAAVSAALQESYTEAESLRQSV